MTKKEIVAAVADAANLERAAAERAFDAIFDVIALELKDGNEVSIPGFGSFKVADRAAREGRNPATGEPIMIPASKNVGFKVSKSLKDSLN